MSQCEYNTASSLFYKFNASSIQPHFMCCHYASNFMMIPPVCQNYTLCPHHQFLLLMYCIKVLEGSDNLLSHAQSINHHWSANSNPCVVMSYIYYMDFSSSFCYIQCPVNSASRMSKAVLGLFQKLPGCTGFFSHSFYQQCIFNGDISRNSQNFQILPTVLQLF